MQLHWFQAGGETSDVQCRDIRGLVRETLFDSGKSYDRWVGEEQEWSRIAAYIENNPVKAGLASRPEDYRWSSAHQLHSKRVAGLGVATRRDTRGLYPRRRRLDFPQRRLYFAILYRIRSRLMRSNLAASD